MAKDILSAEALYLKHMETEYFESFTFGTYNLREITERPIQEGVLIDFNIPY